MGCYNQGEWQRILPLLMSRFPLSVYVTVCLSICLSVCLCICLSVHLSICVYLCICPSVHLSIYVSVCLLSVCHLSCFLLQLADLDISLCFIAIKCVRNDNQNFYIILHKECWMSNFPVGLVYYKYLQLPVDNGKRTKLS